MPCSPSAASNHKDVRQATSARHWAILKHTGMTHHRLLTRLSAGLLVLALSGLPIAAQVDPRNAMLERSAWDALNAGHAHAAADAFREAIANDPKNARLHLGAGVAASQERR